MNVKPGKFFVFEGPDGCGKTTAVQIFARILQEEFGEDGFIRTREIGGTSMAEDIRNIMVRSRFDDEKVAPLTRLLLAMAAREQHLTNVIKPALASCRHVISDRYNTSTLVYQGDVDDQWKAIREFTAAPSSAHLFEGPDVIVYLNVDFEIAFKRGIARTLVDNDVYKNKKDRARQIHDAYHQILMQGYRKDEICHAYSQARNTMVYVVDATTMTTLKDGLNEVFWNVFHPRGASAG